MPGGDGLPHTYEMEHIMAITTDPQTALRLADKALSRLHPARDESHCSRRTEALARVLGSMPRPQRPQARRRTTEAPAPDASESGRVVALRGRVQRLG